MPPTWGKKPLLTVYVLGLHRGILLCWLFSQILQCSLFSYPCPVKFHMKKKRSRSVKTQKHRAGETVQQIKAPVLHTWGLGSSPGATYTSWMWWLTPAILVLLLRDERRKQESLLESLASLDYAIQQQQERPCLSKMEERTWLQKFSSDFHAYVLAFKHLYKHRHMCTHTHINKTR